MISILTYHRVGIFENPVIHRGIHCDVADFCGHLRTLKLFGFAVIPLSEVCDILFRGASEPSRAVALTFDDGYRDFQEYALPALRERGYPATLFAVSGGMGGAADWDGGSNYVPPPLLDENALREIAASGVEIGSHSHSHRALVGLSDAALHDELWKSRQILESVTGTRVRYFTYPFGRYDDRVRDAVRDAGYEAALTTRRAVADRRVNPFEIPRKGVGFGLGPAALLWKIVKRGSPPR